MSFFQSNVLLCWNVDWIQYFAYRRELYGARSRMRRNLKWKRNHENDKKQLRKIKNQQKKSLWRKRKWSKAEVAAASRCNIIILKRKTNINNFSFVCVYTFSAAGTSVCYRCTDNCLFIRKFNSVARNNDNRNQQTERLFDTCVFARVSSFTFYAKNSFLFLIPIWSERSIQTRFMHNFDTLFILFRWCFFCSPSRTFKFNFYRLRCVFDVLLCAARNIGITPYYIQLARYTENLLAKLFQNRCSALISELFLSVLCFVMRSMLLPTDAKRYWKVVLKISIEDMENAVNLLKSKIELARRHGMES